MKPCSYIRSEALKRIRDLYSHWPFLNPCLLLCFARKTHAVPCYSSSKFQPLSFSTSISNAWKLVTPRSEPCFLAYTKSPWTTFNPRAYFSRGLGGGSWKSIILVDKASNRWDIRNLGLEIASFDLVPILPTLVNGETDSLLKTTYWWLMHNRNVMQMTMISFGDWGRRDRVHAASPSVRVFFWFISFSIWI